MANRPLQERAGLNVGNQPAYLTFVQKAGVKTTAIPTNGTKVVILEGIEDGHRSMYTQCVESSLLANGTLVGYDWTMWFEDDQGNQAPVGSGSVVAAIPPAVGQVDIEPSAVTESPFALAPGEKFLLSLAPT
jgi:hypothetical protein